MCSGKRLLVPTASWPEPAPTARQAAGVCRGLQLHSSVVQSLEIPEISAYRFRKKAKQNKGDIFPNPGVSSPSGGLHWRTWTCRLVRWRVAALEPCEPRRIRDAMFFGRQAVSALQPGWRWTSHPTRRCAQTRPDIELQSRVLAIKLGLMHFYTRFSIQSSKVKHLWIKNIKLNSN